MVIKRAIPLVLAVAVVVAILLAMFGNESSETSTSSVTTTTAVPIVSAVASSPVLGDGRPSNVASLPVPTGATLTTAESSSFESYEIADIAYDEVRQWYSTELPVQSSVGEWNLCKIEPTQAGNGEDRVFTSPRGSIRMTLTDIDGIAFVVILMNGNRAPSC